MTTLVKFIISISLIYSLSVQASISAEIIYGEQDWVWGIVENPVGQVASTSNLDQTELTFFCSGSGCMFGLHIYGTCNFADHSYTSPISAQFKVGTRKFSQNLYCLGNSIVNGVGNATKVALGTHPQADLNKLIEAFTKGAEVTVSAQYSNGNITDVGFSLMGFAATVSHMLNNANTNAYSTREGQAQRGQINR